MPKKTSKLISKSLEDTEKIARDFLAQILKSHKQDGALILGLSGELGAGKTHFTQAVGKILGIKNKIVSPTFVIMKKHPLPATPLAKGEGKFKFLFHLDAYRLKKDSELLHLGWEEIISNPEHIVLIEWPELVAKIMPKKHHKIKIKHLTETSREFEIKS